MYLVEFSSEVCIEFACDFPDRCVELDFVNIFVESSNHCFERLESPPHFINVGGCVVLILCRREGVLRLASNDGWGL